MLGSVLMNSTYVPGANGNKYKYMCEMVLDLFLGQHRNVK
jgi:hypothetical protein